jgi:hypothetical protein
MKIVTVAAAATLLQVGASHAQKTDQVAAGAVAEDPAASSATPDSAPTTGMATRPSRSGSGTSTSGGRDDNGDQGRDKMPESHRTVKLQSSIIPNDRRGYLSAMVRAASLSCDLRIGSCPRAKALSASLSATTIRMDRQWRAQGEVPATLRSGKRLRN